MPSSDGGPDASRKGARRIEDYQPGTNRYMYCTYLLFGGTETLCVRDVAMCWNPASLSLPLMGAWHHNSTREGHKLAEISLESN